MDIRVVVDGQRMVLRDSSYRLAPQSQKFIKFRFDLSDDWKSLTPFAHWIRCGNEQENYSVYLDYEDSAFLPPEITKGEYLMMLYGTGSNNNIGTTMPIRLIITDELFIADSSSTEITQSLYDQMVANVSQYVPFELVASVGEVENYLNI